MPAAFGCGVGGCPRSGSDGVPGERVAPVTEGWISEGATQLVLRQRVEAVCGKSYGHVEFLGCGKRSSHNRRVTAASRPRIAAAR